MEKSKEMPHLRIENLCFHTLGPIHLNINESECIGLTGPSGSGKTLFLRALADMDPFAGSVFLGDKNSLDMTGPEWRKKVGMLPSESSWWFDRVGDHFRFLDEKWFKSLGFGPDVSGWEINRLSSGEKQRLALLRVLSNGPEALLLDEPTANLDAANIGIVEKFIFDFKVKYKTPVIWVSHDRNQLKRVSNRCFVIENSLFKEV